MGPGSKSLSQDVAIRLPNPPTKKWVKFQDCEDQERVTSDEFRAADEYQSSGNAMRRSSNSFSSSSLSSSVSSNSSFGSCMEVGKSSKSSFDFGANFGERERVARSNPFKVNQEELQLRVSSEADNFFDISATSPLSKHSAFEESKYSAFDELRNIQSSFRGDPHNLLGWSHSVLGEEDMEQCEPKKPNPFIY